ncbi:FtsK/SpoIIIE domain-containing protein [Aneurinibacillus terranovensis]|uniref:FtsK/SpoIIIE domain-containing protein n=1 Tax=Aneurinibacillus terranovensis TaxID=278991 RepID=UPI00041C0655|nr:FtsK/SpoIIIE domain-containing protein [Aneurinibacillus terranovensis]
MKKNDQFVFFAILAFGPLAIRGLKELREYYLFLTLVSAIGWTGLIVLILSPFLKQRMNNEGQAQTEKPELILGSHLEQLPIPNVQHPMADKINEFCRQFLSRGEASCYSYTEDEHKIEFIISISYTLSLEDVLNQRSRLERYIGKRINKISYHPERMDWVMVYINKRKIPKFVKFSLEKIHSNDALVWVGESADGPIYVDFSKFPHALVGGTTGSGKSVLVNSMAVQIIRRSYAYFIDLKGGVEFSVYASAGYCVVSDLKNVFKLLLRLQRLNKYRMELFLKHGVKNIDAYRKKVGWLERVYVIIDEVSQVVNVPKSTRDLSDGILTMVKELGETSRSQGIHLIIATQKPQKENIPTYIKDNLPIRLAGYCVSGAASRTILDNQMASTELDPEMKGRFILQGTGPEEIFIQTPFIEEDEAAPGPHLKDFLVPPKTTENQLFGEIPSFSEEEEEIQYEEVLQGSLPSESSIDSLDILTKAKLRIADMGVARMDDLQQHLHVARQRCVEILQDLEQEGWVQAPPPDNKRMGYTLLLSDAQREEFLNQYPEY